MNKSRRRMPFAVILLFLCLGSGAGAFAFWLMDHLQAISVSGIIIAVSFIVFLASYTGAFFLYLRKRDTRRATTARVISSHSTQQNLQGTIEGMIPGNRYQVKKSFTDYYGNSFEKGEFLHFKVRHFLPYHGGYTIVLNERALYLQEERNQEIVDHFSDYIAQAPQ